METIAKVRRDHHRGKSIKQIARDRHLSRNTVRKVLRKQETAFAYDRGEQPFRQLGPYIGELVRRRFLGLEDEWLPGDCRALYDFDGTEWAIVRWPYRLRAEPMRDLEEEIEL